MSEQNSLCFPCLEKVRTKFPVFPVPWPPCYNINALRDSYLNGKRSERISQGSVIKAIVLTLKKSTLVYLLFCEQTSILRYCWLPGTIMQIRSISTTLHLFSLSRQTEVDNNWCIGKFRDLGQIYQCVPSQAISRTSHPSIDFTMVFNYKHSHKLHEKHYS